MGFLDKLLGRGKGTAGDVADKSKEPSGAVKSETDTKTESEQGGHERGEPRQTVGVFRLDRQARPAAPGRLGLRRFAIVTKQRERRDRANATSRSLFGPPVPTKN